MLHYVKKDLLSVDRGVIAHGCNYVGVMGAGVAALVKRKYPTAYDEYVAWLCRFPIRNQALGRCNFVLITDELFIANCITQGLESFDGQLATPAAIKASLNEAYKYAAELQLPVYLPKIGAGLGGLSWEGDVEPIINELATTYADVDTYVCVYP